MKKLGMVLLISAFMFSVAGMAQNKESKGQKGEKSEVKKTQSPEKRANKLTKDLGLSVAEKAKVQELFVKQDAQLEKFTLEVSKDSPDYKKKMKELRNGQQAELKEVIGEKKYQQLQEIRKEHNGAGKKSDGGGK